MECKLLLFAYLAVISVWNGITWRPFGQYWVFLYFSCLRHSKYRKTQYWPHGRQVILHSITGTKTRIRYQSILLAWKTGRKIFSLPGNYFFSRAKRGWKNNLPGGKKFVLPVFHANNSLPSRLVLSARSMLSYLLGYAQIFSEKNFLPVNEYFPSLRI